MDTVKAIPGKTDSIVDEQRVQESLTKDIWPAGDWDYELVEEVLVYSKKKKERTGPLIVVLQKKGKLQFCTSRDLSKNFSILFK